VRAPEPELAAFPTNRYVCARARALWPENIAVIRKVHLSYCLLRTTQHAVGFTGSHAHAIIPTS
jgi:hypothetical protein